MRRILQSIFRELEKCRGRVIKDVSCMLLENLKYMKVHACCLRMRIRIYEGTCIWLIKDG